MRDKAILENAGKLESVPDRYNNHQMCGKAVDNYLHTLRCVPDCYITQKMCDKAVDTFHFTTRLKKCVIKLLRDVF